jgi:hypothetical protein
MAGSVPVLPFKLSWAKEHVYSRGLPPSVPFRPLYPLGVPLSSLYPYCYLSNTPFHTVPPI